MNLTRVKTDWEFISKETVNVEQICDTIYGYTSEIAALRLFYKYNQVTNTGKARMGYSENLKTWYFALDLRYEVTL